MSELTIKPYLKAEDIGKSAVVEFLDGGENSEIDRGEGKEPKKTFEISLKLPSGDVKTWTMNKTSQGRIAEVLGFDPAKWKGKKAPIYTIDQQVGPETKKVIYAYKAAEWPEQLRQQGQ